MRQPHNTIDVFLMRIGQNTGSYIIAVFGLSSPPRHCTLTGRRSCSPLGVGAGVACLTCRLFGLGDRVGFRPIMAGSLAFQAAFAFPLFWLIDTGSIAAIVLAMILGVGIAGAASDAIQPAYFPSMFGTRIRYSGVSIGREGGTIIGGELSPLIATALFAEVGAPWPIAAWIVITSLVGVAAVFLARPISDTAPGPRPPADATRKDKEASRG